MTTRYRIVWGVWIDVYNQSVNMDVAGVITTRIDRSDNYWVTEPTAMINPLVPWNRPGKPTEVSSTITTSAFEHNNFVMEAQNTINDRAQLEPKSCAIRGRGENNTQQLEIGNEVANSITTVTKDSLVTYTETTMHRIRKLTPKECLRLMRFSEESIDAMIAATKTKTLKSGKVKIKPMPKSQLYKQAGNSIDCGIIYELGRALWIDNKSDNIDKSYTQLTIFDI